MLGLELRFFTRAKRVARVGGWQVGFGKPPTRLHFGFAAKKSIRRIANEVSRAVSTCPSLDQQKRKLLQGTNTKHSFFFICRARAEWKWQAFI
jgi:hypothetical protein